MKKLKFLLLLFAALFFISCSDDESSAAPGEITGRWRADFWHAEGLFEEGYFSADGVNMQGISVTFNEDGTFVSEGDEFTVHYTASIQGEESSDDFDEDIPFSTGNWEKVGNVLNIRNEGESETYEYDIIKLTTNRLQISLDDYQVNQDGINGAFELTMGFKR